MNPAAAAGEASSQMTLHQLSNYLAQVREIVISVLTPASRSTAGTEVK